jgi:hypothetical protein
MQAACQWRAHLSGRAASPRLARQMVSSAVMTLPAATWRVDTSWRSVAGRPSEQPPDTPSIHADSASGRNGLRPAKHFTRTFSPPPAHDTRTHTHRQTYAGACIRARDARARGARDRFARARRHHVAEFLSRARGERFARAGRHHVAEFLAGHRRHRTAAEAIMTFLALDVFVPHPRESSSRRIHPGGMSRIESDSSEGRLRRQMRAPHVKKSFSKTEFIFNTKHPGVRPKAKKIQKRLIQRANYVTGPGATDIRRGLYDAHELEGRGAYARYPLAFRSEAV